MDFEIISKRFIPAGMFYVVKVQIEKEIEGSVVIETFKVEILDGDDIQEAVDLYVENYLPEFLWS